METINDRVKKAVEEIRFMLMADGGDIELVDVVDNVAKVRLKGACAHCPGAKMTLQFLVEKRLKEKVPEIKKIESV